MAFFNMHWLIVASIWLSSVFDTDINGWFWSWWGRIGALVACVGIASASSGCLHEDMLPEPAPINDCRPTFVDGVLSFDCDFGELVEGL